MQAEAGGSRASTTAQPALYDRNDPPTHNLLAAHHCHTAPYHPHARLHLVQYVAYDQNYEWREWELRAQLTPHEHQKCTWREERALYTTYTITCSISRT